MELVERDDVVAPDFFIPPRTIENIVTLIEAAEVFADLEAGFSVAGLERVWVWYGKSKSLI